MHLSVKQKKFDFGIPCIEFLCTLYNGVGIFLALFPFIKDIGYTRSEDFNQLMPLNRFTASETNDFFLYISGCLTLLVAGIIYNVFVLRRFQKNEVLYTLEAILSSVFVLLLWFTPLKHFSLPAFLARVALPVLLYKILASKGSKVRLNPAALRIIFYGMSAFLCGFFTWKYLLPFYFSKVTFSMLLPWALLLFLAVLSQWGQARTHKYWHWAVDVFVIAVMTALVFKNDYAYLDYAVILGAVNDVLLGKDILSNIIISYGYGNIYFIAAVFKIFGVKDFFLGLSLIISVLYVLGYASVYIFLRWSTKSLFLSIASLFLILQTNFYFLHIPSHWLPQTTLLRLGSYLPVFFFMVYVQAQNKRKLEWPGIVIAVVSLFWVVEYGVYMIAAFAGVMVFRYFALREWRPWGGVFLKAGGLVLFVLTFITLYIYAKYGHGPAWPDLVYFQILYGQSGLAAIKLNISGWVVPFSIYWAAIYLCLKYYRQIRYADSWLFLSFLGLQSFLYFIGKGDDYDFARVSLPSIILAAGGIGFLLRRDIRIEGRSRSAPLKYGLYGLVAFLCVLSSVSIEREGKGGSLLFRIKNNPKEFLENRKIPSLARFLKTEEHYQKFLFDVMAIQKLTTASAPLAILSKNDTLYYISAKRKALPKNAFYGHFITMGELERLADDIVRSDSRFLFVDNSSFQCYANLVVQYIPRVLELVGDHFVKVKSLGFLDVYVRNE